MHSKKNHINKVYPVKKFGRANFYYVNLWLILKTILFLNKVAELGGAEISLLNLVNGIQKHNFQPIVVLGVEGPLRERLEKLNIKTYIYPLDFPHFRNPIPFIKSVSFIKNIIKEKDVCLIHTNTLWDNQYGVLAARLMGIPHILHVRGFPEQKASWKSFYNMGSMAICNSEDTKKKFLKFSGFRKRTEVVYNAVDTENFIPDQKIRQKVRQHYGFGETDIIMGMAGRLAEEKGQLSLLKTLLPMLKNNSNYRVLIVGDAEIHSDTTYPEQIASYIQYNGLDRRVILAGFVEDMPAYYNALDLFLLPSFREPFGRVLIEAMATEKPVIASRVGGVPEVVDHEMNGYLVDPNDIDGWRDSINKLIHEKSLRGRFGKVGREKVLNKFTSEHITSNIASLCRELLGDY